MKTSIKIDGRHYPLEVSRPVALDSGVPRLVIPSYQPTETARNILEMCIAGIRKMTPDGAYELWVVDNNSPIKNCSWLLDYPGINVVLSRASPLPREGRGLLAAMKFWRGQEEWGSYANALGIEIGLKIMGPDIEKVVTLHMDTMPYARNWLEFLLAKLNDRVKASGVCLERHRTPDGVLHVLGCLVDAEVLRALQLTYWPDLPACDVGDKITLDIRKSGYEVFACRSTYEQPELIDQISADDPVKRLNVVRSFDDEGKVIFLHLGRGIPKADSKHASKTASATEWISFANEHIIGKGSMLP